MSQSRTTHTHVSLPVSTGLSDIRFIIVHNTLFPQADPLLFYSFSVNFTTNVITKYHFLLFREWPPFGNFGESTTLKVLEKSFADQVCEGCCGALVGCWPGISCLSRVSSGSRRNELHTTSADDSPSHLQQPAVPHPSTPYLYVPPTPLNTHAGAG